VSALGGLKTLREWTHRAWSTVRGPSSEQERERERELELHLEMAEEALRRQGHSAQEAARLARLRFGTVPRALDAMNEQHGVPWLGRFSLDVRLAARRLRKDWGLTAIGGLAMTIAIAIAAGGFSFVRAFSGETVSLDEGNRVVAIQTWSQAQGRSIDTTPEDFERWRDELRSVEDVGAFRTMRSNLTLSADAPAPRAEPNMVNVAEMSAAGFGLARVPPLYGRSLIEADEHPDAEPVVVIGYDVWRMRFAANPQVIGQRVRLDATVRTVVGVMPKGFAFPINHEYWIPLRAVSPTPAWNEGPEIIAFGRLAPAATVETAQGEIATLGLAPRAARSDAPAPTPLYARITPYAQLFTYIADGNLILLLLAVLLVPPCANIAILVYARTVVRQQEFAIRAALGASRGRIVAQVFLEMLLVSAAAACAALLLVQFVLARLQVFHSGANPFWLDLGVSPGSALYVGALAMLAGAIAGVVPAMQATGGLMQSGLRVRSDGSGARLGKLWSAMIIAQIALAVVFIPLAVNMGWGMLRPSVVGPGFAVEDYMTARVQFFGPAAQLAQLQRDLVRGFEADAGIGAVAVSQIVPGVEPTRRVFELEQIRAAAPVDGDLAPATSLPVAANRVGRGFFETFGVAVLAGRAFETDDFEHERKSVLINRTFADRLASWPGGLLGRRIRDRSTGSSEPEAWYEIVGVVADLPANDEAPRLYLPLTPGEVSPLMLTFRINPGVSGTAGRLREIAGSVHPELLVDEVDRLEERYLRFQDERMATVYALAIVTLSVVLLSAAGMYALMSFTVNQRRREIGLRSALGAQPLQLLAGTFRKPVRQIAAGAALGLLAAYLAGGVIPIEDLGGRQVPGVLVVAALFILVVGVLSVAEPARRALRLAPTEALRDGG
jgi:predicted permease